MCSIKFLFDETLICGKLQFDNNVFYLDMDDMLNIINNKQLFIFNDILVYPYYIYNYKKITLFQYIYRLNETNINIKFKNNNKLDLRKNNVLIYHQYNNIIKEKYNIINYIQGHFIQKGICAGTIKNPLWKIKNQSDKQNVYIMYCDTNGTCKLDDKSYEKILNYEKENNIKITWFLHANGYIAGHINHNSILYIHQIIMDCYGNGKGTKIISVDHIDQDPTNNMMSNLRIVNRKEQEGNSRGIKEGTKRARKHNAKSLPDGLTQEMMPKYVVYYKECYNKEKQLFREFFKIEKHPKLEKIWVSSKSNNIPLLEKLETTIKMIDSI